MLDSWSTHKVIWSGYDWDYEQMPDPKGFFQWMKTPQRQSDRQRALPTADPRERLQLRDDPQGDGPAREHHRTSGTISPTRNTPTCSWTFCTSPPSTWAWPSGGRTAARHVDEGARSVSLDPPSRIHRPASGSPAAALPRSAGSARPSARTATASSSPAICIGHWESLPRAHPRHRSAAATNSCPT